MCVAALRALLIFPGILCPHPGKEGKEKFPSALPEQAQKQSYVRLGGMRGGILQLEIWWEWEKKENPTGLSHFNLHLSLENKKLQDVTNSHLHTLKELSPPSCFTTGKNSCSKSPDFGFSWGFCSVFWGCKMRQSHFSTEKCLVQASRYLGIIFSWKTEGFSSHQKKISVVTCFEGALILVLGIAPVTRDT